MSQLQDVHKLNGEIGRQPHNTGNRGLEYNDNVIVQKLNFPWNLKMGEGKGWDPDASQSRNVSLKETLYSSDHLSDHLPKDSEDGG